MSKTETSGDDAAGKWSIPVNWGEDLAIKAERRRFGQPPSPCDGTLTD